MREVFLALAIVGGLLSLGLLTTLPWDSAMSLGWWTVGAGMALGVPTGAIYHVALYRTLQPRAALPQGWIWRPLELNACLDPDERWRVMPWCYAGGLGFVLVMLGMLVLMVSLASAWADLNAP